MRREAVVDLVDLKLNVPGGNGYGLIRPRIGRSDRWAVDLVYRGAAVQFSALQENIGGQGVCFTAVDDIHDESFGSVVPNGRGIEVRNVAEDFVAVFFAIH